MDTRHLVDPTLLPLLEQQRRAGDIDAESLGATRTMFVEMLATAFGTDGPAPRALTVAGPAGAPDIGLRIHVPETDTPLRPAIFHIHGGGFVIGEAAMSDAVNARRAALHDAVVVSVDYRLAPETPFPGPLEDCHAGLAWTIAHAVELGIDPQRIVVIGESAGGGLAAALALLVRDRGEHRLVGQVLIYPMIDHRTGADDDPHPNPTTGEFIWTQGSNRFGWASMRGTDPIDEARLGHFSPSRAADLAGLPPAFVGVGALDLFLEEDVAYATALSRAGVPVELHVYAGAFHGFDILPGTPLAVRFARDVNDALARMLGG